MKLALKELRYNKRKYILIELIIILLMFMVLFLSGLANGLGRAVSSGIEEMDAKYFLVSDSAESIITVSALKEEVYKKAQEKLGDKVTTFDIQRMYLSKDKAEEKINVTYFAIEPGSFLEPTVMEGKSLQEAGIKNGIILDDDYQLEGIKLGDTVYDSTTKIPFVVVGFAKDQMYGHTSVGFISVEAYTTLRTEINPMYVKSYHALVSKDAGLKELAIEGTEVVEKQEIIESIPSYSAEHMTIIMIIWLLVVISAVIIGVFYYIMTMQKEKQFAVMKALGVGMGRISGMIISQVGLVACFGALISNILNLAMASALPQKMPYYLKGYDALGVSLAFIVISVISSLLSVIKVSKVDPMTVIGGEQ